MCETGFNGGHSVVLWACLLPTVSFDKCVDTRCEIGKAFFHNLFQHPSLRIVKGNSIENVPRYFKEQPDIKCDFISVDVGDTGDVPRLDILNITRW